MLNEVESPRWAGLGMGLGLTGRAALPIFLVFDPGLTLNPRYCFTTSCSCPSITFGFIRWPSKSHERLLQLHEKYGSVVRVGPNELSYITPEAWEAIMGRHRGRLENPKAPWYCSPDTHDIIGAPPDDHARMRRLLSQCFSSRALLQQQPLFKQHVDLLIERLRDKAEGAEGSCVDIGAWYNYCLFDMMGDLSFGESFGCLLGSAMHPWIKLIFANIRMAAVGIALNRFTVIATILPWLVPPRLRRLADNLRRVSREMVARRLELDNSRPDFIQAMISEKKGLSLTREEVENNAMILAIAGFDTTATALGGATYLIAQNPKVQARLTHEVRSSFAEEGLIDMPGTAKLCYLNAVIEESLRMFPPGPNSQPRITPPGGNVILGKHVPGNTVIGIPQRSMFLSETNFRRAREFIPDRWLGDVEFSSDRRDCFHPFSFGPRDCIGRTLAYAELRIILARMVWNFDFSIAESSRNWMQEQRSYMFWDKTSPLRMHLWIRSESSNDARGEMDVGL
ncbi:hypothetical protein CDD82_3074 [Ophiocordyceps australis]|uniref:Uncharacterized protein n=1 Tax=Ophiocordyceps australis TaxID=1399860 RepID=A0A2C5ZGP8_9HYPO|nr:hypothetical protein CDD82_3074 [Ophiocordyceps australis]